MQTYRNLWRLEDIPRDVAFAAFGRNGVFDRFDEGGRHGDVGLHLEEEEDGFVGVLGSAVRGTGWLVKKLGGLGLRLDMVG